MQPQVLFTLSSRKASRELWHSSTLLTDSTRTTVEERHINAQPGPASSSAAAGGGQGLLYDTRTVLARVLVALQYGTVDEWGDSEVTSLLRPTTTRQGT